MQKLVWLLLGVVLFTGNALAADIGLKKRQLSDILVIGEIEPGDFEVIESLVKFGQGDILGISLFSPGGNIVEAIKIGRFLRKMNIRSIVPSIGQNGKPYCEYDREFTVYEENCICASACFLIHVGASERYGNALAVHRPRFTSREFGDLPENEARKLYSRLMAETEEYLVEMEVPLSVREKMMTTPSNKIELLSPRIIAKHFDGESPFRRERLLNKCGPRNNQSKSITCYARDGFAKRHAAYERHFGSKSYREKKQDLAFWANLHLLFKHPPAVVAAKLG